MKAPDGLKYTKTHEWVKVDGDIATVGITDYAQNELGDITFLELPDIGDEVQQSQPFGIVESVKAATDVYAPVNGEVVERNDDAVDAPDLVNSSPYERAWLIKVHVKDPAQLEGLMDSAEYNHFAETATH